MQKVKDRSYGVIPVYSKGDRWMFMIVQQLSGHWSFPKGHPEEGETPQQTASRELKEETGLSISEYCDLNFFEEEYNFVYNGKYFQKTVMYYLAIVEGESVLQKEELLDLSWVDYESCIKKLTYPRAVQICQSCYKYLEEGDYLNKVR
jgi:bis(5'-nucleosidyl)-tetraphosphatase